MQKEIIAQTVKHNHLMATLKADQFELRDMFVQIQAQHATPRTTPSDTEASSTTLHNKNNNEFIPLSSGTNVTYKTHIFENTGVLFIITTPVQKLIVYTSKMELSFNILFTINLYLMIKHLLLKYLDHIYKMTNRVYHLMATTINNLNIIITHIIDIIANIMTTNSNIPWVQSLKHLYVIALYLL